jgi:hypothetical protein
VHSTPERSQDATFIPLNSCASAVVEIPFPPTESVCVSSTLKVYLPQARKATNKDFVNTAFSPIYQDITIVEMERGRPASVLSVTAVRCRPGGREQIEYDHNSWCVFWRSKATFVAPDLDIRRCIVPVSETSHRADADRGASRAHRPGGCLLKFVVENLFAALSLRACRSQAGARNFER